MKFVILVVLALTNFVAFSPAFADRNESASIEQVMGCLRVAQNRYGGRIREVDIERERGRLVCEIKLTNPNGRRIKTYVEVDTGLIVREERRDDD